MKLLKNELDGSLHTAWDRVCEEVSVPVHRKVYDQVTLPVRVQVCDQVHWQVEWHIEGDWE